MSVVRSLLLGQRLFDEEGAILAGAHREYPLLTPAPGLVELDGERVWQRLASAIRELAVQPFVRRDPIVALSISVSGDELLPVDRHGRVLYNTILSMDKRGTAEALWWDETLSGIQQAESWQLAADRYRQ